MPQLDTFTFVSQFFWFGVTFWTLYVLVFCLFIIPAAFIVKAQSVMRVSVSTETPSTDVVTTTPWAHQNLLFSAASSEQKSLDSVFATSTKSFNELGRATSVEILRSTEFYAPMSSLCAIVITEEVSNKK